MLKKMILSMFLIPLSTAFPATPSIPAEQYIEGLHIFGDSLSFEMQLSMEIENNQGLKKRDLMLQMDRQEEEKILIKITAPAFLNNMKYLSIKDEKKEIRWMKTSRGVRRLSPKNNSDSLFGSDFTIEDLSLTNMEDYHWSYAESGNESEIAIKAVPQYDDPSYEYKIFRIQEDSHVMTGIDYYKSKDKLIKVYEVLEMMQEGQIPIPRHVRMRDLTQGSETRIIIKSADMDPSLSNAVFNKSNL